MSAWHRRWFSAHITRNKPTTDFSTKSPPNFLVSCCTMVILVSRCRLPADKAWLVEAGFVFVAQVRYSSKQPGLLWTYSLYS